ncbi:type III-A CRISPR-associated RAMP protein Csm4 [bacterium]|nr:type III-A CRISPR-associated RAMP protein Csm4 [bacterium]
MLNELPRSDTLFGAIATAGALLNYEIDKWLSEPQIRISSAFPYNRNEQKHFLPMPFLPVKKTQPQCIEDIRLHKKFKKLRWIESELWRKAVQSGRNDIIQDEFKEKEPENLSFVVERIIPRNTVNRLSLAVEGGLYAHEELFFADDWSLYFMITAPGKYIDELIASVRLLEDRGLGGDITTGRGAFYIEIEDGLPFELATKDLSAAVTLSLYFPSQEERTILQEEKAAYDIVPRKGFISQPGIGRVFKRQVIALSEGSVLPVLPDRLTGDCPVVAKKDETGLTYDVRFWGRPFAVAVGGKK